MYGNIALLWRRKDISSAWYSSVGPIAMKCLWYNFDICSRLIKLKYDYIKQWKEAAARTVMEWDRQLKSCNKALHSSVSLASFYQLSVKQLHLALLICSFLLSSFHPAARWFFRLLAANFRLTAGVSDTSFGKKGLG